MGHFRKATSDEKAVELAAERIRPQRAEGGEQAALKEFAEFRQGMVEKYSAALAEQASVQAAGAQDLASLQGAPQQASEQPDPATTDRPPESAVDWRG